MSLFDDEKPLFWIVIVGGVAVFYGIFYFLGLPA